MDPSLRLTLSLILLAIPTIFFLRARLNYRAIPLLETKPVPDPDCMVVIPARNEEKAIARAVRSFPPDTVIVVDDDSSDRTAEEARKAGAGVLKAPVLGKSSLGKASACQAGADILTSKYILFADADTWYEPGFTGAATSLSEARNLNFLSVILAPEPIGFGGTVLAPYFQALFFAAVDPRSHPTAVFYGQCVLLRRQSYVFVGGHGSLQKFLCDDVRLAAVAVRHRMQFGVVRAGRAGHMTFHADGIWEGVRRNAFRFNETSLGMGAVLLATALLAALWLPLAVFLWLGEQRIAAAAVTVLPILWLAGWYRSWRVLLAPLAIYLSIPILVDAAFSSVTHGDVEWKGRTI